MCSDASDTKVRCFGNGPGHEAYAAYHDREWGVPQHDDVRLFELLVLEGAQAGLSWETVLNKRAGYRRVFHGFDPARVAAMTDRELERLRDEPAIVRNRLKIESARRNARAVLDIQAEFGSLDRFLWAYVDGKPIVNRWHRHDQVPASTPLSETLSRDLKRRGMNFVGPTIVYAFMQATGMVNDHLTSCWRHAG